MIGWKYSLAYLDFFFFLLFNEQVFFIKIKTLQNQEYKAGIFFF